MKKIVLLLLLLACFTDLSAQAKLKKSSTAEKVQYTETPLETSKFILSENPKYCGTPKIVSIAVVNYFMHSVARIVLEKAEGQVLMITNEKRRTRQVVEISENQAFVNDLAPNAAYGVWITNNCGTLLKFAEFDTKPTNNEAIQVNKTVFNELNKLVQNKDGVQNTFRNALDFVEANENINYYDKLSFIQQYFFKGKQFHEPVEGQFPELPDRDEPSPQGDTRSGGNCNCKFVINTSETLGQGGNNGAGVIEEQVDSISEQFGGDNDLMWGKMAVKGAAKYHHLWTKGKRTHTYVKDYVLDKVNNSSPAFSELAYNYFCTDEEQIVDSCGCEKKVNVAYRYDTRLSTEAKTHQCFFCGSKGAMGAAEDWAFSMLGGSTAPATILQAGNALVKSQCKLDRNVEFYTNIVDLAGVAAQAVISFKSAGIIPSTGTIDTALVGQAQLNSLGAAIPAITSQINKVIRTPLNSAAGCGSNDKTATLLNGKAELVLKPNKPVFFSVFSSSCVTSGGYTSWSSSAKVVSNFYMVGVSPTKNVKVGSEICCSPTLSNWIIGNMQGAPITPNNQNSAVNGFLSLFNAGNTKGMEIGKIVGDPCK